MNWRLGQEEKAYVVKIFQFVYILNANQTDELKSFLPIGIDHEEPRLSKEVGVVNVETSRKDTCLRRHSLKEKLHSILYSDILEMVAIENHEGYQNI